MRTVLLAGVSAVGLAIAAPAAKALPTLGTTGPGNDIIGDITGWFGASWSLVGSANTLIDVYFVGREAGATNTFTLNAFSYTPPAAPANTGLSSLFGGGTAPVLVGASLTAPGLLSFSFTTDFFGPPVTVANSANPLPPTVPNFFSAVFSCDNTQPLEACAPAMAGGSSAVGGNTLLIALDDGGGRNPTTGQPPDDNHDDLVMIIRLSEGLFTIPVPEPATLGLLGAGLLGLGFAARRRRQR